MNIKEEAEKIKQIASKKGYINKGDIYLRLVKSDATAEQIEEIVNLVASGGIEIREDEDEDDISSLESLMNRANLNDPIKMYFKDIGKYSSLTHEEESEMGKRMK